MIKTGERTYCIIAEWTDMDALARARPNMIATHDSFVAKSLADRKKLTQSGPRSGLPTQAALQPCAPVRRTSLRVE